MDEEEIKNRVLIIGILAILLFISQSFLFTNIFSIGSLVFSAVFCYFMFFLARNSLLHKKALKDNLRIKERKDIRINFWG